jgi:formylglycine-generating enzyme required for sulfatase activity
MRRTESSGGGLVYGVLLILLGGVWMGCGSPEDPECRTNQECGAGEECRAGVCLVADDDDGSAVTDAVDDGGASSDSGRDDTGRDATEDAGRDVVDDARPDTQEDVAPDAGLEGNGCGGSTLPLVWEGVAVALGDACGCGGTVVCNGTDAARCAGEVGRNECGGCGSLPDTIGAACDACGGTWACGPSGDPVCRRKARPNGCGGCASLDGAPGRACAVEPDFVWVCDAPDTVTCVVLAADENVCGGTGPLTWGGREAFPGESCEDAANLCGAGVLVCAEGRDGLVCEGVPTNAAGGCGALLGVPGEPCGCGGAWEADATAAGGVRCVGGAPNACGGCVSLTPAPGAPCGPNSVVVCSSADETTCIPRTSDRNACGGTQPLGAALGGVCGACDTGRWGCDGAESVRCEGDEGANAFNECTRTCEPLLGGVLGGVCGACDQGTLVCGTSATLACDEAGVRSNACGGCAPLAGAPTTSCGQCAVWECTEDQEAVACRTDATLLGCGAAPLRCADLACASDNRECTEAAGATDAVCGTCVEGYEEVEGACRATVPAPTGVTASQGTSADYVEVTWDAVPGATGYHVYRDGVRVTAAAVTDTTYNDTGAAEGGAPAAVTGVNATRNRPDEVVVTWDAATVPAGATASYQVLAIVDGREGQASSAATGFRGAQPVTGYEVQIGAGSWRNVGSALTWTDEDAPAGSVTVGTPTATTTQTDGVVLSVATATTAAGATREYRVRAVNAAGVGTESGLASGNRSVGAPSYQWQWSTTAERTYSDLSGATGTTASDTEIAAGAARWYRVGVSAAGGEAVTSSVVQGWRRLSCADLSCASQNRTCTEGGGAADAACGACVAGYEEVGGACLALIPAPSGVAASQGTSTAQVVVTWNTVAGVSGYHVYRDGVRVTTSPVTETSYNDTGAAAGGVPTAVTGASATTNQPDDVRVTWGAATAPVGATASYLVRAVLDGREGAESTAVTGFRAAQPVTGYEVQIGAGDWQSVGSALAWTDEDAPAGSVTVGTPTATTTQTDGVILSVATATTAAGATREYRVRAVNAAGAGPESEEASGNRSVGAPSYQWQWSTTAEGTYSDLSGATGTTASDTEIAAGAARWYRVGVSAAGASSVTSVAVQGQRATSGGGSLGAACTADSGCPSGAWCPTDTSERRCSPRPTVGGVQMPFQWVPRGTFTMGSPEGEDGRNASREAQVEVSLTRDYFVQRTEVTQGQWSAVMGVWNALPTSQRTMSGWTGATPVFGTTPSCFATTSGTSCASGSNPNGPVERVSWWDAVVFANTLSILEGLDPCYTLSGCGTGTGVAGVGGGCSGTSATCSSGTFTCSSVTFAGKSCSGYRLPTEAEWERSARGGTTSATYNGNLTGTDCAGSDGVLNPIAWYTCNSGNRTQAVGGKTPNAWGLYDMLGNVWEWTWTWYEEAQSGGMDPLGPSTGSSRVLRGASWGNAASLTRSAFRDSIAPGFRNRGFGFRLVRSAP